MNKFFYLFLLFFTYRAAAEGPNPIDFFPANDQFNIFLGPNNRILLQSKYPGDGCDYLNSFQENMIKWRNKVEDRQDGSSAQCQCGRKEIDPDIQNFFMGRELREREISDWQLLKKRRVLGNVTSHCYMDLTDSVPERMKDLAVRQMVLDKNLFESTIFLQDGVNCYNTGLFAAGILNAERYVGDLELSRILEEPICQWVKTGNAEPGDLVAYYWQDRNGNLHNPVHLATYVGNGMVFDKKGGAKDRPFQLSTLEYTEEVYQHPSKNLVRKFYRCRSPQELKEKLREFPEIARLWDDVDEIERCYQGIFVNNELTFEEVDYLRDTVLIGVLGELDLLLKDLQVYDREKMEYSIIPGKEEEYVILQAIYRRASTMVDDQHGRSF